MESKVYGFYKLLWYLKFTFKIFELELQITFNA